jgi:hypothetical protein
VPTRFVPAHLHYFPQPIQLLSVPDDIEVDIVGTGRVGVIVTSDQPHSSTLFLSSLVAAVQHDLMCHVGTYDFPYKQKPFASAPAWETMSKAWGCNVLPWTTPRHLIRSRAHGVGCEPLMTKLRRKERVLA